MIFPINFEPLKGFRDYYPRDYKELEENLFKTAKEIAESLGFEQIDMPLIENTEFLLKKSGEEIREQIFNILPKKILILISEIKRLVKKINNYNNDLVKEVLIAYKPTKSELKFASFNLDEIKNLEEKKLKDLVDKTFFLEFGEVYLVSFFSKKNKNTGFYKISDNPSIFVDKSLLNPEMSLRFDLTMPAIRMAIRKYRELVKPIKWFYIAKNYRYEEPQKGRDREFFQIGVEFFGEKSFVADLEVLNFAITFLNKIGLKDKYKVKVNNRKLMDYLISELTSEESKKGELYRLIDKIRKIGEKEFKKEALDILKDEDKVNYLYNLIKRPLSLEEAKIFIEEFFKNSQNKLKIELLEEISFLKLLEKKAFIEFDLSIVRGLDYYTDFVFEIYDKEEKYRSLGGGGRYDNLAEILGFKERIYATGLALGPSVLEVFMKDKGLWKSFKEERDFIVIPISKEDFEYSYFIAEKLREKGFKVEFAYKKGVSKNLDFANKKNVKFAIIIGEEERKKKKVKIKDLKSGNEKLLDIDLAINRFFIDKIDKELSYLLEKRFEAVLEISKIKKELNIPIENKEREKEVISNFKVGRFKKEKEEVIKKIIEESKKLQEK
ncbi:MAG TPA: hypothetical protein EYH54_01945 [Nautiliaceae bacterium]|nr:hypothetical protein [Nautiliaceae bacterium]